MARTEILVVEDEHIVAETIRLSVENMGFSVSAIVPSGERAMHEL